MWSSFWALVVVFWALSGPSRASNGVLFRTASRADLRAWGRSMALFLRWGSVGARWGSFFVFARRWLGPISWPQRCSDTTAGKSNEFHRRIRPQNPDWATKAATKKKKTPKRPREPREPRAHEQIKKNEGNRATRDDQGAQGATTRKAPRRRLEAHRGPREPTAGCRRPTGSTRGELARSAVWAPQAASRAPPRFPPSRGSRAVIS